MSGVEFAVVEALTDGAAGAAGFVEGGNAVFAVMQGLLHAHRVIAYAFDGVGGFFIAAVGGLIGHALKLGYAAHHE